MERQDLKGNLLAHKAERLEARGESKKAALLALESH